MLEMRKKIIVFMMVCVMVFPLMACGNTVTEENTKAQKETESKETEKIQIVFEYQDGHVNEEFESALETMFDVDIIMDMNKATSPYLRLEQGLTHNMAPDMVLCEYIRRIEDDVQAQYFYDLGSENFVNDYYLSAIEACTAADGGFIIFRDPVMYMELYMIRLPFQNLVCLYQRIILNL